MAKRLAEKRQRVQHNRQSVRLVTPSTCDCCTGDRCQCCIEAEEVPNVDCCTFTDGTPTDRDVATCTSRGGTVESCPQECCELPDGSVVNTITGTQECANQGGVIIHCPRTCEVIEKTECETGGRECGCPTECWTYLCQHLETECGGENIPIDFQEITDCPCIDLNFCEVCEPIGDGDISLTQPDSSIMSTDNCVQGGVAFSAQISGTASGPQLNLGVIPGYEFFEALANGVVGFLPAIEGSAVIAGAQSNVAPQQNSISLGVTVSIGGQSCVASVILNNQVAFPFLLQSVEFSITMSGVYKPWCRTKGTTLDELDNPLFPNCNFCYVSSCRVTVEMTGTWDDGNGNQQQFTDINEQFIDEDPNNLTCALFDYDPQNDFCPASFGELFAGQEIPAAGINLNAGLDNFQFDPFAEIKFGEQTEQLYAECDDGTEPIGCIDPDTGVCTEVDKAQGEECPPGTDRVVGGCPDTMAIASKVERNPIIKKKGPGDHLKDIFAKWRCPKCSRCSETAAKMNAWGPELCRKRLDAYLIEESDIGSMAVFGTERRQITASDVGKRNLGLVQEIRYNSQRLKCFVSALTRMAGTNRLTNTFVNIKIATAILESIEKAESQDRKTT